MEAAAGITIRWLEEIGLQVATEKSELILFTNRRVRNTATITLNRYRISSKTSIRYLGLRLDPKLNFKSHAKIAAKKAGTSARKLARIMSNVGASKSRKRRLPDTTSPS